MTKTNNSTTKFHTPSREPKPLQLLITVLLAALIAETVIMVVFHYFINWPEWVELVLDAALLTVFLFPLFYFLVFVPFNKQIAKRRKVETALKDFLRKYSTMVEFSNDLIFTFDTEGKFTYMNHQAEKTSGYKLKELSGKSFVTLLREEDAPNVRKTFLETLSGNGGQREVGFKRKDGEIVLLSVNAAPLYDKDAVIGTVNFCRDITAQRKAETELQNIREEFVSMLVHDLKSPLSTIMSSMELLDSSMPDDSMAKNIVKNISQSGDIMLNLINNIVNASKIESGKIGYVFEKFNLIDLLNQLQKFFQYQAILKKINLVFNCRKSVRICADYEKIQQVFFNLLSNAVRYTTPGGTIKISAESAGERVNIQISDTGYGISDEGKKNLFQKFTSTKDKSSGTGLGLYIVKKFLEGHGSDVSVESELGKGTKFFFTLPAAE